MIKNTKRAAAALLMLAFAATAVCTGCAAKSAAYDTYSTESYACPEEESVVYTDMEGFDSSVPRAGETGTLSQPSDGRKVILSASATLETKEYDAALNGLLQTVTGVGGYVAQRSEYNYDTPSCNLTLRIPSEKFDSFLSGLSGIANVTDLSQSSEDITDSYIQTESYLESLSTQQTRLLELMEQAESLEDLLTIEDRLADVRAQLQYYDSLKNTFDSRLTYSEITVYLHQVRDYTVIEPTFGERIGEALRGSGESVVAFMEQTVIVLIYALPILAVIAVPTVLIILLARRGKKRRAVRKAALQNVALQPEGQPEQDDKNQ